ncbi:MAG: isocitrate/isopropylmalate family dehydrogenase, partial [Gemmatimonadaceae bacterium]
MPTRVTLIPGDGIGPEISAAAVRVLEAAQCDIEWEEHLAGVAAIEKENSPMPDATLRAIRASKVALKGPLETPVGGGYRSVNVALRKELDLFANVRPAHTILLGGRFQNVDLVLVRENTQGLYSGIEHYIRVGDDDRA